MEILIDVKHGSWLLGGGWNNDIWGGDLPMASWIDSITPHNPVRHFHEISFFRFRSYIGLLLRFGISHAGLVNKDGWSYGLS